MKLYDRRAIRRVLAIVLLLLAAGWGAGRYMCHCGGAGGTVGSSVQVSADHLRSHVQKLAGTIGERNVFHAEKLAEAADYIEQVWRTQGDAVNRQTYKVQGVECANLEVVRPGSTKSNEIIVVGAHYDSVAGSPGANDNASGVAALLELSRLLTGGSPGGSPSRTIRFVAFVNEEPPWFQTGQMGSQVYAKAARARGDDIRAMISLETMGCYSDEPGSQKFPMPVFRMFYPNKGNFIGFVSNLGSRALLHRAVAAFKAHSDFPVECCATFGGVPGVGWSDHDSFWREGYPAFMVTDTAPFRYPHYHEPTDTPDKVDHEKLARVTEGLRGVVTALATD